MKFDHIITPELRLLESLQRGADPLTHKNLQIMHENFVVPYSKYLKSQFTLMEAEMTADQIQQVFGHAERIASAGGDNKTLLGKGADAVAAGAKGAKDLAAKLVPQAVKDKFTKSLPAADAGPVEGFEQKATQAIAGIQDPQAKQSLMDKIKIGLQNPATQQLIMAGVSGIAGVIASTATAGLGGYAGAAAAGAITGSLLGAVNAKMQGKSWGDAGKAALKGAALGAAGGLIGKGVTNAAGAAMDAYQSNQQQQATAGEEVMPVGDQMSPEQIKAAADSVAPVDPQAKANWERAADRAERAAFMAAGGETNPDGTASDAMKRFMDADAAQQAAYSKMTPQQPAPAAPAPSQTVGGSDFSQAEINAPVQPSAAVQDIASQEAAKYGRVRPNLDDWRAANLMAKGRGLQTQSRVNTGTPVIEYIDRELTARMWILHESVGKPRGGVHLTEAGIGDMFKKAGNWLKTKAGNLTNKVTADKLQQAWTKAGSPTESTQVAAIMAQAGVPQETVDQIFKNMGIANTPATSPAADPQGKAAPAQAAAQDQEQKEVNPGNSNAPGSTKPAQAAAGTPQQTGGQTPAQGQDAPAGGAQQPAQAAGGAPASTGTPQQTGGQTPGATPTPPAEGKPLTNVAGTINSVASGINAATDAINAGQGMGTSMRSLAQVSEPSKSSVKIKDAQGQEHDYKKVGQQWFDKDNKPVNAAQAAMLDKQAEQQAALGAKAPAQQPDKMLANPKDPKTGKPIDPKAQAAAGGAQQPAQAAAGQKPAYDTQTGVANDAMKAVNKAAGKAAAPYGFNTQTGEPNPAPGQSETGEVSPEYRARQKAVMTPGTPEHSAIQDQIIANADENKLRVFAASAQTPGTKEKAAAELKRRGLSVEEPAAAAGQPAQAQSPEEIRKAKQATAAKTAQDQMSANAAAPAGQAAPAAAKAHTGGKVAGQVSQTPNAIRKREQRAAAAAQKAAPNDVMARMAKQLAPAQPAATPNFGQQQTGYASVKMNAPTGIPQQPAVQPTTGAKVVPAQQPAATPAAAPTASAQADAGKPGFLQSKIKGSQVPAKQPEMAGMDFSAMLARKAKIRL